MATVIAVIDGDTLLIKSLYAQPPQHRVYKLRLADIDAPEKDQPYGEEAKRELAKLVLHQPIRVVTVATDHYGRRIGWVSTERVHFAHTNVNLELVKGGWAWALTRHRRHPKMIAAQRDAQSTRRGLWAAAQPIPPWVWRNR